MLKCLNLLKSSLNIPFRTFAGKTKMLKKFKTPTIKMHHFTPVYPPPGLNLQLPDWKPEYFMTQIGADCGDYGDKFKNLQEIFTFNSVSLFSYSIETNETCRTSMQTTKILVMLACI